MPELPDISAYITALEQRILGQRLERVRPRRDLQHIDAGLADSHLRVNWAMAQPESNRRPVRGFEYGLLYFRRFEGRRDINRRCRNVAR